MLNGNYRELLRERKGFDLPIINNAFDLYACTLHGEFPQLRFDLFGFSNIGIGSNSLVICSKQIHIGLCPSRTDLYDPFLSELYEFEDMVS